MGYSVKAFSRRDFPSFKTRAQALSWPAKDWSRQFCKRRRTLLCMAKPLYSSLTNEYLKESYAVVVVSIAAHIPAWSRKQLLDFFSDQEIGFLGKPKLRAFLSEKLRAETGGGYCAPRSTKVRGESSHAARRRVAYSLEYRWRASLPCNS
jgi:hypothetical protein